MRTAAVVCNVVLLAITGVILLTEGVPRNTHYLVVTLLLILVPLLNTVVLVRKRMAPQKPSTDDRESAPITPMSCTAVLCNVVLFGASCWEGIAQYPYPEGNGVIPFVVLAVCTPILTVFAILRGGTRAVRGGGGIS